MNVHEQALANAEKIRPRMQPIMDKLAKSGAEDIINGGPGQTNKQRLTRLFKVADQVITAVGQDAACKNGCSHCCYQAVAMNTEEAKRIAQSTGLTMTLPAGHELDLFTAREKYTGKPCPFLKEGRCSIYCVRPMACRLHFNLSDEPDLCDIIGRPGEPVPSPDLSPLVQLQVQALDGVLWADVRTFFPQLSANANANAKAHQNAT